MLSEINQIISLFVVLWAVIDPIGTVPVFIAVTKNYSEEEKKKISYYATIVAGGVLLFFLILGEKILRQVGVPLTVFQISGGVILFMFALDMIFGDSKPETELQLIKTSKETAIFPLAIPSIASPGAILAVVLMTESYQYSLQSQFTTAALVLLVLYFNFLLMRYSTFIGKKIGQAGSIILSKVMGLILASIAANNTLIGIKEYFMK